MSWLKDLRNAIRFFGSLGENRSAENPKIPLSSQSALEYFNGAASTSGVAVNEDRAMGVASIFAGVRVIAESVASLPLETYERTGDNARERYRSHPSYGVLKTRPNPYMSAFNFFEYGLKQLVFRGNMYAEIEFDGDGYARNLWPLPAEATDPVFTSNGRLVYVTTIKNQRVGLPDYRVLHISALGDGINGKGILDYARETIGYAAALDEYQGRFFSNGAHPSGFLKVNKKLSPEARQRIKSAWQLSNGGLSNAHRTAVFEEDIEWEKTSVSPEEAQALETRKMTRSELAGILRVPAHFINDLERATFSNIEHLSLDFVIHTLRPWLVRIEQELNYKLFRGEPNVFAEFNVDGLLRGDKKSRAEALEIERRNGVITANEWRQIENKNPIGNDYGDSYMVPLNNSLVSPDGRLLSTDPSESGSSEAARALFEDVFSRIAKREVADLRKIVKSSEAQLPGGAEAEIRAYYESSQWIHEIASPVVAAARSLGAAPDIDGYAERSLSRIDFNNIHGSLETWVESRVAEEAHKALGEKI